jgi:hypothetical protein
MTKPFYKDLSFWMLLFSNGITIGIAVAENWSLITIVIIYWIQSCIIGFFNIFRILSLKTTEPLYINKKPVLKETKYVAAVFFTFHYGLFHLIYGAFLLFFAFISGSTQSLLYLLIAGVIFFFDHLFSFNYNRKRDEQKKRGIARLMFFPYARILPMHIIILVGIIAEGSLFLFLGLKTLADVLMHVVEHQW